MSASVAARGWARERGASVATRFPWLIDGYRAVRRPHWALMERRDLAQTRRETAWVRRLPAPARDAPVALVALYRDDVFDAKIGLVLATALRMHGMRPVLTVPSARTRRAIHYGRAFGVGDCILQEDVALDPADERGRDRAADDLLAGPLDFDSITEWDFRGWNVGRHVLSTLIRLTFDGAPDLSVDSHRVLLGDVTREVLTNLLRAERVFDDLRPTVVVLEEANYSVNGPLADVATARGADVVQTIQTWRDDALMSKRLTAANRREDPKSVAPETFARLASTPWTSALDDELDHDFAQRYGGSWQLSRQFQPDTEARSRDEVLDELDLDPSKKTAVVFAHVLWDATLFFGVDLFANYSDWLVQTVGAAIESPGVNWIVKTHPSNVFRSAHGDVSGEASELVLLEEHFAHLPTHVRILRPETAISSLSLYRMADYGVTVRGTPGLEMASLGRAVFTAGTSAYAGHGFTHDSATRDEYLGRLRTIDEYGPLTDEQTRLARRAAHALFVRRPWAPRSFRLTFDFPERGWNPFDRNVTLLAASADAVHAAGDLDRWAEWVLGSRDADYLDHDLPPA